MAVVASNITKGIFAEYNGDATLKALVSGFYYDEAPADATMTVKGYIVFHIINWIPSRNFTAAKMSEDILIQFSVFDANRNVDTILAIYDRLDIVFDLASLTVTGYNSIVCKREAVRSPIWVNEAFGMSADYVLRIQKS